MGSETFEGIYFEKYSKGLRYCTVKLYSLCLELCFIFLLINIENI